MLQLDHSFTRPLVATLVILIASQIIYLFIKKIINTGVSHVKSRPHLPRLVHQQRLDTLASLLKNIAKFSIWGISLTTVLSAWDINIAPILAGAGVLGLAIGFGAQTLVRDIMTGLFILGENYMNVGDFVELAGKKGRVVSVKLRTTIIKEEESGTVHIIPNSSISIITKLTTP